MKKLATILILFVACNIGHAQENNLPVSAIGIDVSTPLILLAGGDKQYLDFEILYRITRPKYDLRIKATFSGNNFCVGDAFGFNAIEFSSTENQKYFIADNYSRGSFIGSFGLSKMSKNQKIPMYIGLDANIGIVRNETQSNIRTFTQGFETVEELYSQRNTVLIAGVTPVLGFKKQLTDKASFVLEFGVPLNFVSGNVQYNNENGVEESVPIAHTNTGQFKVINDIAFFINL